VPLTRGRVEKEIFDLQLPELAEKVVGVCRRLSEANDLVIVEGMGHVAMGSCLKLSAADVARIIGARALLVSSGGIGRTIDQIALCATFLEARQVPLIGAVVNQVWPEKYERVKQATVAGLAALGIRSLGTMPFEDVLASPTVGQVCEELGAELLCGAGALDRRVGSTIVGAMEAHHMVRYVKDRALVITPGDRSDNILAVLSVHMLDPGPPPPVAGLALTGGFQPDEKIMSLLRESGLPAMLHKDDTYTLAARLRGTVFKITPEDTERIQAAMRIVEEHLDVDAILEGLKE
jgi:BioD-like phosphotransacetylase family protein